MMGRNPKKKKKKKAFIYDPLDQVMKKTTLPLEQVVTIGALNSLEKLT
jgi:hypothetical protein